MNIQINGEFEMMELGEETVLLSTENFTVTTLNSTGIFCFKKIQQGRDLTEIIDEISEAFEVEARIVQKDVERFIEDLKNKGLLINEL